MSLKERYEESVNEYITLFCKKQKVDNCGWVNNTIGEVFNCDDMAINFDDIRRDIDHNIPARTIIIWYRYVESYLFAAHLKGIKTHAINYRSYLIGARYEVELSEI